MVPTEVFVAKRASKRTRVTAAKRSGRTIQRTATRSSESKATPKKTAGKKAAPDIATASTESNQDSVAKATQTTLRKTWKGQQQDAEAFAKIQHGAIVDQRAHVRATTGHRWTARKTH